jgi:hypothetical protein
MVKTKTKSTRKTSVKKTANVNPGQIEYRLSGF